MDGLDADGEWSDASEGAVKSGSATDASRGELDLSSLRRKGQSLLPSFAMASLTKKDPVCHVLEKIDAELAAITPPPVPALSAHVRPSSATKLKSTSLLPFSWQLKSPVSSDRHSVDTGLGTGSLRAEGASESGQQHKEKTSVGAEIYTDGVLTDDDTAGERLLAEDQPSDLDSVAAAQIDNRFKEIMSKKKGSHSPKVSTPSRLSHLGARQEPQIFSLTTKLSTGYATDNESIRTEDFECRFRSLMVTSEGNMAVSEQTTPRAALQGPGQASDNSVPSTPRKSILSTKASQSATDGKGPGKQSKGRSLVKTTLQHSMKSLGETTPTLPEESASNVTASPALPSNDGVSERKQPGSLRPKTVSLEGVDDLDATTREIERQSACIQRDLERERRARSVSPIRGLTSSSAALPPRPTRPSTPARLQTTPDYSSNLGSGELFAPGLTTNTEASEKTIAGHELKTLREALFTTKLQLKAAEKEAKEMRDKADEARSHLMLVEFKRSAAAKDLDRVIEEISRKREMSQLYDTEVQAKLSEIRGFQALGISVETVRLLQEENAALKLRQRGLDGLELERDELARQLETAKDDLLREQKQARLQREELSEEIETLTARLEEIQHAESTAQQHTDRLEHAFRQMEREKNEVIQETTKELAALKAKARQESRESRQLVSREMDVINTELQELRTRVNDLLGDNKVKDEECRLLRDNVEALESRLSQEQASRAAVTEEHRKTLQMLRKETDTAMLQLRESLFLDKQRALEDVRAELENERRDSTSRADERMAQLLSENASLLSEKNKEIVRLQEKMREIQRVAEKRVQDSVDQKIREAVARESARLEAESQWKVRTEREAMSRDAKQMVDEMQVSLTQEKEITHHLKREISQLKEEQEEQRRQSREAVKEKLVAVARAKEQMREQGSLELEKVKDKVRQDMQREVDRLQAQLREVEEEVRTLKSERQQILSREKDSLATLDRMEKTVINELNDECRRGATVLGVSPRQVQFSALAETTSSRSQITAALANLRAVNEEVRNHVQELSTELDRCRTAISGLEKEKNDIAVNVRLDMERKSAMELEKLKEKLIKEHAEELAKVAQVSARQSLANSMVTALRRKDSEIEELKATLQTWRDQTAEKIALVYKSELARELEKSNAVVDQTKLEQRQVNEMQQREISRLEREVQRLAMMQQNSKPPPAPRASSPSPLSLQQQHLQARIKQLSAENDALRRKQLLSKNNLSVPDLSALAPQTPPRRPSSPTREYKTRSLEERIRLGEKEAIMAEERARFSQSLLSNKIAEMTKLQNTLNNQNQELQQLEKAYTQLHRQYNNTPVVPASHLLSISR